VHVCSLMGMLDHEQFEPIPSTDVEFRFIIYAVAEAKIEILILAQKSFPRTSEGTACK